MKLSIIIPSYNYARYLPDSLNSVLNQKIDDYEVIVVDDGSTDESVLITETYAKAHRQIKLIRNETNLGIFKCLEKGLAVAKGEFIHLFSADDLYLTGFLSNALSALEGNPSMGMVCTDVGYFKDGSHLIETKPLLADCGQPLVFTPEKLLEVFQKTDFWIPGATCIFKKEWMDKHGKVECALENISDWFHFHRIALFEGVLYLPQTGVAMRVHEHTYTQRIKKDKKRKIATYRHLLKLLSTAEMTTVRKKFKDAALLTFIFKELFWKLLFDLRYIGYWRAVNKKYPIKKRLLKRFMS